MDDLEAVALMRNGDISGLEAIVHRYQLKAVRTAFLVTQDEALAEDVVQETFLRLYRRIRRFDTTRPLEPYLMRSVVNAALNALRHENKSISLDADTVPIEGLMEEATAVEAQVEFSELCERLLQALARLAPRERAAIVQRYYLELSEREMSRALDAAPGTIKWLLHTARGRLRDLLQSERNTR
jgi:RNA polymerase sigma-70 factor (ECF subfamily)